MLYTHTRARTLAHVCSVAFCIPVLSNTAVQIQRPSAFFELNALSADVWALARPYDLFELERLISFSLRSYMEEVFCFMERLAHNTPSFHAVSG